MKHKNKPLQILLIITMITALLAPAVLTASPAQARISENLVQLAA